MIVSLTGERTRKRKWRQMRRDSESAADRKKRLRKDKARQKERRVNFNRKQKRVAKADNKKQWVKRKLRSHIQHQSTLLGPTTQIKQINIMAVTAVKKSI